MDGVIAKLAGGEEVYAVQQHERGQRFARITSTQDQLYLHHLSDRPAPPLAYTIPYKDVESKLAVGAVESRLVWLDLAWDGVEQRRVTIRLSPSTLAGQQFFLLATGKHGPSYANTRLLGVSWEGEPGENILAGDYDGRGGAAIVKGLKEGEEVYRRPEKAGAVWGLWWGWQGNRLAAQFCITTRTKPDGMLFSAFGHVETGLDSVLEAAGLGFNEIENVVISDCGVVVPT